jgi:membrane protein DedA with SNARE-associated domain
MSLDHITSLIIEYRYLILIPLSVLEGPIVAFAAGALVTLGYFNIYVLAIFFLIMDMAKDGFYYSIGYWGGRVGWAHWLLKKIGVQTEHLEHIRALWETNPGKTMFIGKLSYGVASTFVVLAGTVKMRLGKFFGWGAVVAISQYWTLLALGYYFGTSLSPNSQHLITDIQYGIAVLALVASAYYLFGLYMRGKWKKETGE